MNGICAVSDCEKPTFARGYCNMHYSRLLRHGDVSVARKPRERPRCSVAGCGAVVVARSLCGRHYQRWIKYGDPARTLVDPDRTIEERFWSKVDKVGPVPEIRPELGPCWLWTAGTAEGYGMFSVGGKQVRAHILSFTWAKGKIPEGWERDHLCRVRRCVNPAHLEAVEHWTNVARGASPAGINTTKTHCPRGHPYDAVNTYVNPKGERVCRECARERTREWWRRTRGRAASG